MVEQLEMTLTSDAVSVPRYVALDELRDAKELIGADPDPDLVRSVGRMGVRDRVQLAFDRSTGEYRIMDGRRRVRASLLLRLETIPADVVEYDRVDESVLAGMALHFHAMRRANPAAELQAIERLFEQGHSEQTISQRTGLPRNTIQKRLGLRKLHPSLRRAFDEGRMGVTAGELAAKLPLEAQGRLASTADSDEPLTLKMVQESRQAGVVAAAASLPTFEGLPTYDDALLVPPQAVTADLSDTGEPENPAIPLVDWFAQLLTGLDGLSGLAVCRDASEDADGSGLVFTVDRGDERVSVRIDAK